MSNSGVASTFFRQTSRVRRAWMLAALAIVMLPGTTAHSEMRMFSDDKGRSITAELLEATADTVTIRRDDGRVFDFPRGSLSPNDEDYVAAWLRKRAFAFGGVEIVGARRVRLDTERRDTESTITKKETWCFKFAVENKSRATLDRITAEYRVYHVDDRIRPDKEDLPLKVQRGSAVVGTLAPGAKVEVQTMGVELDIAQLKIGWKHRGTNKRRAEDSLEGVWIRIMRQGEILAERANPSSLPDKQAW